MSYLVLRGVSVRAMNARNSYAVINVAPVMAALGFAHNLGRQLGGAPRGVAILHEDAQPLGEWCYGQDSRIWAWHPQQRRGSVFINKLDYSTKNDKALSLQPTASAHLTLSLVIEVDGSLRLGTALDRFMAGARLAGGQVDSFRKADLVATEQEARALLNSGFWLIERQDLMDERNPLEALIRALGHRHPAPADDALPNTWLTPTTLGYALVSPVESRAGARDGAPHAFCEPLIGLTQYVSLRQYGQRPLPLWRGRWTASDVYLATTQQENHS